MNIRGLQKTTLIDYPGKVACIVFTAGCNFRCPFCHNSDLVLNPDSLPTIKEEDFFEFLKTRIGKLDGIVITGGEPTLQNDLPEFAKKLKELGFSVKLDTNGTNPEMVESLIKNNLVNYVAMDLKGPFNKYYKYTNVNNDLITENVKKTIKSLVKSGIDFELRTTVVPTLHDEKDLLEMAKEISNLKLKISNFSWVLQKFRPINCLDPKYKKITSYQDKFFHSILIKLQYYVKGTSLRN